MGVDPVEAPEVSTDVGFSENLARFEQQQSDINIMANSFREGIGGGSPYNLRDLLVEMVMSQWFRVNGITTALDSSREIELADMGVRRLLTPRELDEKTYKITGMRWDEYEDDGSQQADGISTGLETEFNIYYGGIDGKGALDRARQITPVMANVAEANALWLSCAIVMTDINLNDGSRRLFNGIDRTMTPTTDEMLLKEKLTELHELMWGETVSQNSTEIEASYALLTDIWDYRKVNDEASWAWSGETDECMLSDQWWQENESNVETLADDPDEMLGTWISMVVYFMTDFNFLHE